MVETQLFLFLKKGYYSYIASLACEINQVLTHNPPQPNYPTIQQPNHFISVHIASLFGDINLSQRLLLPQKPNCFLVITKKQIQSFKCTSTRACIYSYVVFSHRASPPRLHASSELGITESSEALSAPNAALRRRQRTEIHVLSQASGWGCCTWRKTQQTVILILKSTAAACLSAAALAHVVCRFCCVVNTSYHYMKTYISMLFFTTRICVV